MTKRQEVLFSMITERSYNKRHLNSTYSLLYWGLYHPIQFEAWARTAAANGPLTKDHHLQCTVVVLEEALHPSQ